MFLKIKIYSLICSISQHRSDTSLSQATTLSLKEFYEHQISLKNIPDLNIGILKEEIFKVLVYARREFYNGRIYKFMGGT